MTTIKREFTAGDEKQAAAWAALGPANHENRQVIAGPGFDIPRWLIMVERMAALVERQPGIKNCYSHNR